MDDIKYKLSLNKYKLPYHWIRDPLHKDSLFYFGYVNILLNELPTSPAKILDVGCGDGRISAEMVSRGYEVTGLDYLSISILYAKTMVPEGTFMQADLRKDLIKDYSLRKEYFDAVVMVEVYEHIPPEDCSIVLENVHKVLKPGGIFIISVPSKLMTFSSLHYRHFELDEFGQELKSGGFKIQKMIYQHSIGRLTKWLFNKYIERLLNNQWLQPVFLKRLRKRLYMRYANTTDDERQSGRFIAVTER